MENLMSPWALSAANELSVAKNTLKEWTLHPWKFSLQQLSESLWITVTKAGKEQLNFRLVYAPGSALTIKSHVKSGISDTIKLNSAIGEFEVLLTLDQNAELPLLKYTTTLVPKHDLIFPFWERDILITNTNGISKPVKGKIHASQEGTRTGFCYFSMAGFGSTFYFQNLTSLNSYFNQTETSAGGIVGAAWPELGLALPPANDKAITAGTPTILSDAIIAFDEQVPDKESDLIVLYLNMLAGVYRHIPQPDTIYRDWPTVLDKGLKDLIHSPGCWQQVAGHHYFNAYVSDHETPPEIMVQLAVLLPLLDYVEWSGKNLEVMKTIKDGLPSFYNEDLGTIMRWLPAAEDKLKVEEEQKVPLVMDSWYLHHPLLNLSRLALKGDKDAKKLFLDSINFAIKVAHHFKYKWPVFYKMDTLEVIKAETSEGKGGEKDVAGLYTHVMLQAWELTAERRYLNEAEQAARSLEGYGFEVFYQANNTAFSSGALLRLYKITKNERYLNLSYMCLAGIFRNTQLWECNYGYSKNFPTFFALFPLNDAPYTAVYEEQEVFCALHDYLKHAAGVDILPSLKLLIAEYIRHLVNRAMFYYPTMLPKDMLEEKPKVGEVDHNLWIALEDLHDGWEKSASVGQEVYGAGNAFGILPRHYFRVPDEDFMIYVDYPAAGFSLKGKSASFRILGDKHMKCRLMLVKTSRAKIPDIVVTSNLMPSNYQVKKVHGGNLAVDVSGDSEITVKW